MHCLSRAAAAAITDTARSACPARAVRRLRLQPTRHRAAQGGLLCRADARGHGFDASLYVEATLGTVRKDAEQGPVLHLKLNDGIDGSVLVVYVGEAESNALLTEMNHRRPSRPMTHDLFKNAFELLGYKVVLARITALVGSTYHARVHLRHSDGSGTDVDVDARPSDAINLAVRFGAPILVAREVASKMGTCLAESEGGRSGAGAGGGAVLVTESATEIVRSCRREVSLYADPTLMLKLQMQLCVQEERYEEASELRDQVDKILAQDQAFRLIVAIETAIDDKRYEEAARLRDDLSSLRSSHHFESDASTSF